jgi:hypothetical protein
VRFQTLKTLAACSVAFNMEDDDDDTNWGSGGTSVPFPIITQCVVSSLAARRIFNILRDNGDFSSSLFVVGDGCLDLTRLNLKQLKAVARAMRASEEFNIPKSGARKYEWVNAIADIFRQSPDNGLHTSAGDAVAKARRSPSKVASQKASTQTKSAAKRQNTNSTNAIDFDEAMARGLQQQYMQDGTSLFVGFGGTLTSNTSLSTSFPHVAAPQHMSIVPNHAAVAGRKRPAISSSNDVKQPVKVKKEPQHHATSTNAHSLSHEEDGDRPRDTRESSLVDTMRSMGFTDNREILSGIRAVAAQREGGSVVAAAGWSSQDHVEAAMLWIISQREEAAEARKVDEARFSSERVDAEMMQRRNDERELEMMSSGLIDLLGSVEEEFEISSRYFPHSVILQSRTTKQMFATISSLNDSVKATRARKEVLRYLILEKKASDWYGRVLPYSFFHYSAKSRFESWAKELLKTSNGYSDQIIQRLMKECDELERALYNLSEQEEGGVANVPKVFIHAQRDAAKKGLPTTETRDLDDEIEVLEHFSSLKTKPKQPVDVIEIL